MNLRILTITDLTKYIKGRLEGDYRLTNIWIRGEISNFKLHSSGHIYLTLKDENSAIKGVMFRSKAYNLIFRPENGMKVIVRGSISVYERDGQYQLYLEEMQPDGIGALHLAFEQLKESLKEEGLFDEAIKKPIPFLPTTIGVVTSPTGAAIRDIITVIKRRFPNVKIVIYPVRVQGDEAPGEINKAIENLNKKALVDVIILGRGGGSIEELWAFNTEVVARAIYASKIPIISAVGHETDFTIADFVADVRAATPSAAAELVVPHKIEVEKYLHNLESRLTNGVQAILKENKSRLEIVLQLLLNRHPKEQIRQKIQEVDNLTSRLEQALNQRLTEKRQTFCLLAEKLQVLSPLAVLQRGYSITRLIPDEVVIKDIAEVKKGDRIEVILGRGTLECLVEEVKGDQENGR
jgi:exodeoxyribonuclease VII large subunit